jgi:hypothetical protein
MSRLFERRNKRSANTTRALCYQLEACRQEGNLTGMVLADDDGCCIAASGDGLACDEVAAQMPLVGRKVAEFEGILFSLHQRYDVKMRRFDFHGAELYMCAIGESKQRDSQIAHSIGGVSRILQPSL